MRFKLYGLAIKKIRHNLKSKAVKLKLYNKPKQKKRYLKSKAVQFELYISV